MSDNVNVARGRNRGIWAPGDPDQVASHITTAGPRIRTIAAALVSAGVALSGCSTSDSPRVGPAARPATPSNSGVIAFRRFFDAAHREGAIFTISADGRGERQVSHPPVGQADSLNGPPSFTPDGGALIFDRTDANAPPASNGSLWHVNTDGTGERRLPTLDGLPGDGWPALSPDGRRIAVARAFGTPDRFQNLMTSLYVLNPDGSAPRQVAPFGYRADVRGATWSPNGKRIVFSALNNGPGKPTNASALYSVAPSGRGLRRITPWDTTGEISSPAFSPDGQLVLFQIKPKGQGLGGDYYTIRADGSDKRKLSHFPGHPTNTGSARWSPDGHQIVFANTGVAGQDDIFIMRADGTHVTPLTRTPLWESAPAWAPGR